MADLKKLAEEIVGLTLLEAQELKTILKDEYGIEPAAGGAVMMAGPAGGDAGAAAAEEKTEFDVVLKNAGAQKINVIKEVRAITGLGLKEAKDLVEAGGKVLVEPRGLAADARETLRGGPRCGVHEPRHAVDPQGREPEFAVLVAHIDHPVGEDVLREGLEARPHQAVAVLQPALGQGAVGMAGYVGHQALGTLVNGFIKGQLAEIVNFDGKHACRDLDEAIGQGLHLGRVAVSQGLVRKQVGMPLRKIIEQPESAKEAAAVMAEVNEFMGSWPLFAG